MRVTRHSNKNKSRLIIQSINVAIGAAWDVLNRSVLVRLPDAEQQEMSRMPRDA